jgi:oligoribonuclease NrnB/cAMP/cGMP phosphodiesterase (DHH superfamily)
MKYAVIYHNNCMDGLAAAAAAKHTLGDTATYLPMQYGDALPKLEEGLDGVIFVDFCLKTFDDLKAIAGTGPWVLVIDHHKTAAAALEKAIDVSDAVFNPFLDDVHPQPGEVYCVYDQGRSGAVLSYEFFVQRPVPQLYLYVQDRDMWWWRQPRSRSVSAALADRCFGDPDPIAAFEALPDIKVLASEGDAILKFQGRVVASAVEKSWLADVVVDGTVHCAAVAHSSSFRSEVGEALLAKYPDAAIAVIRMVTGDSAVFSLRSRNGGVDVSAIAKRYGGGGHAAAAGFSIPRGVL